MSTRQVIAVGVLLGVTAALVVWWLERFEVGRTLEGFDRLHHEVAEYLANQDKFRDWLRGQEGGGAGG